MDYVILLQEILNRENFECCILVQKLWRYCQLGQIWLICEVVSGIVCISHQSYTTTNAFVLTSFNNVLQLPSYITLQSYSTTNVANVRIQVIYISRYTYSLESIQQCPSRSALTNPTSPSQAVPKVSQEQFEALTFKTALLLNSQKIGAQIHGGVH